jgi:hypothetical protein
MTSPTVTTGGDTVPYGFGLRQGNGEFIPDLNTGYRSRFSPDGGRAGTVTLRIGRREVQGARKAE